MYFAGKQEDPKEDCPKCGKREVVDRLIRTFNDGVLMRHGAAGAAMGRMAAGEAQKRCLSCGHTWKQFENWADRS